MFKIFKVEVENQLNKRIEGVKSGRGGEYYSRYDDSSKQCLGLFVKYLEECSIISQYTMPDLSTMNDVAERRNRMLKDMVRSMTCDEILP